MTESMVFTLSLAGILLVLLGVLRLRHVSLPNLVLGIIGAILGLIFGALASEPVSKLPAPLGSTMPVVVTILFTAVLVGVVLSRRTAILALMPFLRPKAAEAGELSAKGDLSPILVDTSVIIDGRIADIASAGFVPGRLAVPRFVLAELQNIADSEDAMRRGRGRRGLEVLNQLRDSTDVEIEILDEDVAGIREVDAKLVALGQKHGWRVLTTDFNLNRVAQIQGVRVLNVNELSNAIRPVVLPGEQLMVRVVQPGKERNQGVGYLADGTMIVVENGDKLMGQEVATEVTRVFQTVAGKMIFAVPRKSGQPIDQVTEKSEPAKTQPNDQPTPAQDNGNNKPKNRFNRPRKHNNEPKPVRSNDIEGRIIAATTKSHQQPEQ